MYLKTATMFAWWIATYLLLITSGFEWWGNAILCISFGLASSGIGFNVMHDANHGSYSDSSRWNRILGWSVELIGISGFIWRQEHNVRHHTYTNVTGLDEGLEAQGSMRWSPYNPWKPFYRYQHLYWPVIYAFSASSLMLVRNFKVFFTGRSADNFIYPRWTRGDRLLFWLGRGTNLLVFIGLPLLFFEWYEVLAGFGIAVLTAGMVMATILQLSHVMRPVEYMEQIGDPYEIRGEWAVHQVESTIDFAPRNRLLSWYIGGLNYQIEHHLFPKMCHLNYPQIAPIVRQACEDYGVSYRVYPTFRAVLSAHVAALKWLGKKSTVASERRIVMQDFIEVR